MSSSRAERLVNLVLCLLSTRQFLTAERIRSIVPGYADASGDAFFRTFERDKAELRELGVPLESGRALLDTAEGYRIARQDYELGEIDLESDEAAAVALAARLWDSPELAAPAHGALVKLRAAGVEVEDDQGLVQPRVRGGEPAFAPLLAAVQAGRAVTFGHRRGGPAGEVVARTVEPWGVVSWHGRWYLVGHDRDRDAPRSFRVSRIGLPVRAIGPVGAVEVPSDVDVLAIVRRSVAPPSVSGLARVWVAAGRAHGLRRLGRLIGTRVLDGRPGDELELELRSVATVARWLAGHGPDVVPLGPETLVAAVRANWSAAAVAHGAAPVGPAPVGPAPVGPAPALQPVDPADDSAAAPAAVAAR